jgi:hypothetical protein
MRRCCLLASGRFCNLCPPGLVMGDGAENFFGAGSGTVGSDLSDGHDGVALTNDRDPNRRTRIPKRPPDAMYSAGRISTLSATQRNTAPLFRGLELLQMAYNGT